MDSSTRNLGALLRYAQQLIDELSEHSRESPKRQSRKILRELGTRSNVRHALLLIVRTRAAPGQSVSLLSEWSEQDGPEIGTNLQNVPLALLGADVVTALQSGSTVFTSLDDHTNACSKLISGMLRELDVSGCALIPIVVRNRLAAIIGLAHDGRPEHLPEEWRSLIQLIGKTFLRFSRDSLRERRRRREHHQWKRVVSGACDFALRVNRELEIVGGIPFRQKRIPQVRGLLLQEFVAAASRESLMELIQASVKAVLPRSTEFLAIDANGRSCSYAVRIEPAARNASGDLTLYLTNNDVERAHAEELHGLREQLDRATRLSLLGNIATEFAHQLTQPLQAVSNNLYTLKNRLRNGESSVGKLLDCAGNIETSINHASDIIQSLRDFVRDRRMKPSAVCLRKMIDHAVSMIQLPAERLGAKVSVLDPHQMLKEASQTMVYVDRVQTTHVIINLLVNAIEACSEANVSEPQITILTKPTDSEDRVVVEVSDNGPGLPPGRVDTIFERFFTTKSEGFGIGLAICRDVIERQGGNIRARSNADRGCCFFFTLLRHCESIDADSDLDTECP